MTSKTKGFGNGVAATSKEETEQFLCSMFRDESEISLVVVRDVLCQCGYEVEKALDALLELASSSRHRGNSWEYTSKTYAQVLAGTPEAHKGRNSNLSQMVLESLFIYSKTSPEYQEPRTMKSWKSSVKELQDSLGPEFDVAKGAEYDAYRGIAKQHWDSVTSYHQKAATAYSNGSRAYAGYLSQEAKVKAKMAREAEEKASLEIFKAKNKDKGIENDVMTIDLHGQHVKKAMKLLKTHLLYGTNEKAIRFLRVITGHGSGKSILKQSVIKLFQNEGIKWSEENPGALLIKLTSQRDYFRFMERDEDVKALKALGVDSYDFPSPAWTRILPSKKFHLIYRSHKRDSMEARSYYNLDGTLSGGVNQEGIHPYNNLIDELIKNGKIN